MGIINTRLEIGVEKPFKLIHISDTHLTLADMRDGERKVELSKGRAKFFEKAEEMLTQTEELQRELGLPVIHTGDLIDFVSVANLERAKAFVEATDCFMTAGNHEFSLYVGEAKEDAAYREQSLATVQAAFKNDIRASSRVIGGVNFVALDDGYYNFEQAQLDFLKAEVAKGLPVVLVMHNPLFEKALYDDRMANNVCAYLVGVPEELMSTYPENRYEQQLADAITRETLDYIAAEPAIKALITGHVHVNYEGVFAQRIPQVVVSCTDIQIIEIV
jgi:3',5'-cyclic AMP phosphodiesterase CpdA